MSPTGQTKVTVGCSNENGGASSDSSCYRRAAQALHKADYLLVLAGAGMSADSGLGTYETMPSRYREFCDPARLATESTREEFQAFWKTFALQYASTKPHEGYAILDNWCHGQKLKRLSEPIEEGEIAGDAMAMANSDGFRNKKWWVYTSNVDGHFRRFPSFRSEKQTSSCDQVESTKNDSGVSEYYNNICEIHGCAGEFRCSCGIGYFDREKSPRMGELWTRWNQCVERIQLSERCNAKTETLEELKEREEEPEGQREDLPPCNDCGKLPLRPNVLLFNDTDENVLEPIQIQRQYYQDWEAMVESRVCDPSIDANFVLVEIGCGTNVPAVRNESEEVLADTLDGLSLLGNSKGSARLIRINPKEAGIEEAKLSPHVISIYESSIRALTKIDKELDLIIGAEQ